MKLAIVAAALCLCVTGARAQQSDLDCSKPQWTCGIYENGLCQKGEGPCGYESQPRRAYTLDEIDRMRDAVKTMMTSPTSEKEWRCSGDRTGCPMVEAIEVPVMTKPTPVEIEARLNTYMAAGIAPEALEAKAREGNKWD